MSKQITEICTRNVPLGSSPDLLSQITVKNKIQINHQKDLKIDMSILDN